MSKTPEVDESKENREDIDINDQLVVGKNETGIPEVVFIDDIGEFQSTLHGASVEVIIGAFSELHKKYKFMEESRTQQKASLKQKLPEIEKTLELVKYLMTKNLEGASISTRYCLSDNVYARAEALCDDRVCLWLGANVMVEYNYEEALTLLSSNLETAQRRVDEVEGDLRFLRTQIITTEVNMARLFNSDVFKRRKEKQQQQQGEEEGKESST